jgi:hypothetical protein
MYNAPDLNTDIIAGLANLEPGKLPLDIFNQIARLTVTPVVEIVPFYREQDGQLKVFLLQRSDDDPLWAGMYHVPGGAVIATDTPGSFSDALERITVDKLIDYQPTTPRLIDTQLCKVSRGTEVAIIYMVFLSSAPALLHFSTLKNSLAILLKDK